MCVCLCFMSRCFCFGLCSGRTLHEFLEVEDLILTLCFVNVLKNQKCVNFVMLGMHRRHILGTRSDFSVNVK